MWTYEYIWGNRDQAGQMLRTYGRLWLIFFKLWKQECCFHTNEHFSCTTFFCKTTSIYREWQYETFTSTKKIKKDFHDSNNILRVLYNWQLLALGRLWISTLLIMSNTRCQSWMSDEQWEDGTDECAMRGLFVFWPGNCVKTHNLQNPSEASCPTDYMFIKAH